MDGGQVKVAVYNLYWSTFGGGEQQAGGIADALSSEHEVELVGPAKVDLQQLRDRLGLRLDNVTYRVIEGDEYLASLASADYDLFINHTYRSVAPCLAPMGVYFVMFPHEFVEQRRHAAVRSVAGRFSQPVRALSGFGRHPRTRAVALQGPALVQTAPGVRHLSIQLDAAVPEHVEMAVVRSGGHVVRQVIDGPTTLAFHLPGTEAGQVILGPVTVGSERDDRTLLRVIDVKADGVSVTLGRNTIVERLTAPDRMAFLDGYQRVVALSDYTLHWTRQWWGRGDAVVSPPVTMRSAGTKEKLILSVGRFFDEQSGHSKRQLEMVRAFRTLVETGLSDWRLVLIGGCSPPDREYAMAVRREAEGLPVEVRFSAPGPVVDAHLAAASIYWHAAGFGSDLAAHPDRAEHFGIAPIEAMSAGAVPVVFGAGGPAEVIQHEVNGLHYQTIDELVAHTRRLVDDAALRERLGAAAVVRAHDFDRSQFEHRVRALVAGLVADAAG